MLDTTTTITKRRWTAEDDARLAELRAQGRTDREIGVALGRTWEAVRSRRQWLREMAAASPQSVEQLPEPPEQEALYNASMDSRGRRTWTPNDDAYLLELREGNTPDDVIAVRLHRTVAAVQARLSKLRIRDDIDIPKRRWQSPWTPERIAQARAMQAEGLTVSQIAMRLSISGVSVGRALRSPEAIVVPDNATPDLARTALEVDRAMADLARARDRHKEAMEVVLRPVREAILQTGLLHMPAEGIGDRPEDEAAWQLVDHLRRQGVELRVRT